MLGRRELMAVVVAVSVILAHAVRILGVVIVLVPVGFPFHLSVNEEL